MKPEVAITFPSPESEYEYLTTRVLSRLDYFKTEGSNIILPSEFFLTKLLDPQVSTNPHEEFLSYEFDPDFYLKGYDKLQFPGVATQIERMFPKLFDLQVAWELKILPRYGVTLSKYGPGSVILKDGTIVLRTDAEGNFSRPYPVESIAREIVCMGIGGPIMDRFDLQRKESDRIADYIIISQFSDIFPNYRMAKPVDADILTEYFSSKHISELPALIGKFIENRENRI